MSMAVNHLGHFLLVNLLLDDMKKAKGARCVIVGSITGNTNTVGGGLVYPKADLGKLQGMQKVRKAFVYNYFVTLLMGLYSVFIRKNSNDVMPCRRVGNSLLL